MDPNKISVNGQNGVISKLSKVPVTKRGEAIEKMRNNLNKKLQRLDEVKSRVDVDQDILFDEYDEMRFVDWLTEEEGRDSHEEIHYLYVSSAARDKTRWPSPGEYNVSIDGELDNIIKCDLVQMSFPLTESTVTSNNNKIRFSIAPHSTINEASVPEGNYTGEQLAIELTRQMNQTIYSADILAGTYYVGADGLLYETVGDAYAPENQFFVTYRDSSHKFYTQLLDSTGAPNSSTAGAIYVKPKQGAVNTLAPDDIYAILGFNRDLVAQEGFFDAGTGTYALYTTTSYVDFGPGVDVDNRIAYSVIGNQVAELHANRALILDIPQLNDNDVSQTRSDTDFKTGSCFGIILQRDPATVSDRILENSSSSYPVQKYYRDGRSRVNNLTIRIRRVDGTLFTFGGADHIFTLKFTLKRTQPKKSVFAR